MTDEEMIELHAEEVSRSYKVVGLKAVTHKGSEPSVPDACVMGQNCCNINEKVVESCMAGANSKKEGSCMIGANSKPITNAPQIPTNSCSNKTSSIVVS